MDEDPDWLDDYTWVSNMGWFFTFPEGSLSEFGIGGDFFWGGVEAAAPATDAEFAALVDTSTQTIRCELCVADYGYCWNTEEAENITAYELLAREIIAWRNARESGTMPRALTSYIAAAYREWKDTYGDGEEGEKLRDTWESDALGRFKWAAAHYTEFSDCESFTTAMLEQFCFDHPFFDFGFEVVPATAEFTEIWRALTRSVREIIKEAGIKRGDVAYICCVPIRTIDNWIGGVSSASLRDRLYIQHCLGVYSRPVLTAKGYRIDIDDFWALIGREKWCDLVDADCGAWYTDSFAPYNDDPITVGMLHRIANAISDDTSARHYSPPEEVFAALSRIANLY